MAWAALAAAASALEVRHAKTHPMYAKSDAEPMFKLFLRSQHENERLLRSRLLAVVLVKKKKLPAFEKNTPLLR
jgi:hypothetical protein